jgi:hypothetical protein
MGLSPSTHEIFLNALPVDTAKEEAMARNRHKLIPDKNSIPFFRERHQDRVRQGES